MYVLLTTRCNMSCEHCAMNCTSKGIDMSLETWRDVKEFIKGHSDSIELGGGEPTIHKHFKSILMDCIMEFDNIWLATNGSMTEISLGLARLAKKGVIVCELSLDSYHDPIDGEVIQAFTKDNNSYDGDKNDLRGIRNTESNLINAGRCDFGSDGCVCDGLQIYPDGRIKACGCDDAPYFGTIWEPEIPDDDDYDTYGCCHSEQNEQILLTDKE